MYKLLFTFISTLSVLSNAQDSLPIIIDTDFAMPPQDDSLALMLALQSPELEILGITTVAGNDSVERATADPEPPNFRTSKLPNIQTSEHPNFRTSEF